MLVFSYFSVLALGVTFSADAARLCRGQPVYQYHPFHSTMQTATEAFLKIPQNIPSNTAEIRINNHNITIIEPIYFENINIYLKLLDLRRNQITEIEPDAFYDVTNLKTLLLGSNNIQTLENKVFNGLNSMEKLDLSNNKIGNIAPNTFCLSPVFIVAFTHFYRNLTLVMDENILSEIQNNTFYTMKQLSHLLLKYNMISHIDKSAFNNNKYLKQISLVGNMLASIQGEIFSKLALVSLDLSNNTIHTIEPGSFSAMTNSTLSLENNPLTSIGWNIFFKNISYEPELKGALPTLYLGGNNLTCSRQACWLLYGLEREWIQLTSSPFESLSALECQPDCPTHGEQGEQPRPNSTKAI